MATKSELRKKFIEFRKSISKEYLLAAEEKLLNLVVNHKDYFKGQKIACYWSIGNEMPTQKLIQYLVGLDSALYLPTVAEDSKIMKFCLLEDHQDLKANIYNILEPVDTPEIDPSDLDIILLPCVCFDEKGYRIGMGKGYYDYSLSDLNNKGTELIVIAFEFQKIDDCLHGKHDVKAHSCITDEYFYNFD